MLVYTTLTNPHVIIVSYCDSTLSPSYASQEKTRLNAFQGRYGIVGKEGILNENMKGCKGHG